MYIYPYIFPASVKAYNSNMGRADPANQKIYQFFMHMVRKMVIGIIIIMYMRLFECITDMTIIKPHIQQCESPHIPPGL